MPEQTCRVAQTDDPGWLLSTQGRIVGAVPIDQAEHEIAALG